MNEITGRYTTIDGARTYYEETGEGSTVVCVHTMGANCLEYRYLLPLLAEKGYRVVTLDLPGHAHSYPVNWEPFRNMTEYGDFVFDFAQEISEEDKPIITGCSIGGGMMLDIAAHHSEDLSAIIAFEGGAYTRYTPTPDLKYPPLPGWQDIMEEIATDLLFGGVSKDLIEETKWIHRNSSVTAMADFQSWAAHDVRGELGDVECPVLVVKGKESYYNYMKFTEDTVEELPDEYGDLELMEGIGHYPMLEDPEGVAEIIDKFVSR